MPSEIINRILERINRPDLVAVLAEALTGSELNSILLEVFNRKTESLTPPMVLNLYQQNRFVKPSDLPVLAMKQMELDILQLFQQYSFEAIELSPVSILGSCSVVGPADQKKILSALRGTEVLADSTNAIALHVCDRRQNNRTNDSRKQIKFCNIQRQVRTQAIEAGKGFTPHFKIGCLVTCGMDTGGFGFEKNNLNEHIQVMKALFLNYYKAHEISFRLLARDGYGNAKQNLLHQTGEFLRQQNPGIKISIVDKPEKEINYYKGIQYKVDVGIKGKTYEIADGGFVDWTQKLLQNKKERMLSTGFGFDIMHRIQSGDI